MSGNVHAPAGMESLGKCMRMCMTVESVTAYTRSATYVSLEARRRSSSEGEIGRRQSDVASFLQIARSREKAMQDVMSVRGVPTAVSLTRRSNGESASEKAIGHRAVSIGFSFAPISSCHPFLFFSFKKRS